MAKQTVTIYIDDTSLRLVTAEGKGIVEFGESALEPGLVENNTIVKEAEVAAVIKTLFAAHNVKATRVSLGISGTRCLTRPVTLPKLPREMLQEAVTREAQRVLPVSLEDIYLSWQTIPVKSEQTQIFMVGIPRKTTDAIVRTLRQAGLKLGFMEIKPLLLTRAVRETTAVIVDVQATEFDVVVTVDGIPQPVRSIRFATAAVSMDDKLTSIKSELTRTLTFYNTNNPERPLADTVPIFASGELADCVQSHLSLSQEVGHPVSPMPAPVDVPDGMSPGRYMTNICLGLSHQSRRQGGGAVSALNAVPAVYQTKAVSLANILALPSGVAAVAVLAFLLLFGRSISDDIASINKQLTVTNQQVLQKQTQRQQLTAKVTDLQRNVDDMTASRNNLTALVGVLETEVQSTGNDLALAMNNAPRGLTLSSIRHVGSVLTLIGKAAVEKQVLSYIEKLGDAGQFRSVVVTDMTRNEGGTIDFTVVGTLQEKGVGVSSSEVALGSLPTTVSLTSITSGDGAVTITGTAPNANRVLAYSRALEASQTFKLVTIGSMTRIDEESTTFSLVLTTGD